MRARLTRSAPWMMIAGNILLLLGLWRDAALHAEDPTLAAREGIFTLANGGHVLLVTGIGLLTLGASCFLLGRLTGAGLSRRRRVGLALPAAAMLAVALATAGVAASDESGLPGAAHEHGTPTADHDGATPTARDDDHDHDAGMTATPTAAEQAAADELVAETQAEAARFADFAVAEAEGYVRVTPLIAGRGPAHYVNPAYAADDDYLDPARPEALIYLQTRDGEHYLLGVMYLAPLGEGPTPGGPLTQWHGHAGLCTGPTAFSRADENGECPTGQFPVTQEMMHVWVFDHPDGPLAHDLGRDGLRAAYLQFVL